MRASALARCHRRCSVAVVFIRVSWRSVAGNVAVVVRCCCCCRAAVSSCHHGDGHASGPISVPDCECRAFQGRRGGACVHTRQVDLLTAGFKAAPPPRAVTSHANANGSHRPALTHMMNSVTTAIGIPCCPGLQRSSLPKSACRLQNDRASLSNITRSVLCTAIGCLIRTQLNIFDLHNRSLLDDPGGFFFFNQSWLRIHEKWRQGARKHTFYSCKREMIQNTLIPETHRREEVVTGNCSEKGRTLSKHTWQVIIWSTCPSQANFN